MIDYPLDNDSTKVEVLRLLNDGWSYRQISERLGVSKSAVNNFVLRKTYKAWWDANPKPIASGEVNDHHADIRELSSKRFILTAAQNNTYVHEKFLRSLEMAAKHLDAQILVGTFSYNTHGFQNLEKGDGEWFDPKLKDYILDEPAILANGLMWCGELNILPTAVNPLSGLHSYTKTASGIVPHAKVQLESLPTHKNEPCRMLYTTGTVTLRNYISKKAGQKASFHHVFGALLVEVDDHGDWFVRQLIADSDTGEFHDLDKIYTPTEVKTSTVEAIVWGDIHVEKLDMEVFDTSMCRLNPDSMLDTLKPKYQFIHDALDFEAKNHHNIADPYHNFLMHVNPEKSESVQSNCMQVRWFLEEVERDWCQTVVVESNHDLALKRWLKESDYKRDPVNAIFFLECQLEMYKQLQEGNTDFSVLEWVVKKDGMLDDVKFLKLDESFKVCDDEGTGIEVGAHGHLGSNGSRGSVGVYQRLGSRYTIGHSHSAAIKDGVYQVGVSGNLDMGYNLGASSWSHSHCVIYPNGKRSIITLKNGKWHA